MSIHFAMKNKEETLKMNKKFFRRNSREFTLIELLVVITILAILAGAAVPYVQNNLDDARISTAKSDLNEIRNATEY